MTDHANVSNNKRPFSSKPKVQFKEAIPRVRPRTAHASTKDYLEEINATLAVDEVKKEAPRPQAQSAFEARAKPVSKSVLVDKLPPPTASTAHRRYTPVNPCCNTLLAKKWDDASHRKHRDKIAAMKACVDNHNTAKVSAARLLKKNTTRKEWEMKIAKENVILLERMARTFTEPSQFSNYDSTLSARDRKNKEKASILRRSQEMARIDKENKILLDRINHKKPMYQRNEWKEDDRKHQKQLLLMSRFPEAYKFSKLAAKPKKEPLDYESDFESLRPRGSSKDGDSYGDDFEDSEYESRAEEEDPKSVPQVTCVLDYSNDDQREEVGSL